MLKIIFKILIISGQWLHTPLIPALRRQRQSYLSLRLAWSTEQVLGQPGLHRETLWPEVYSSVVKHMVSIHKAMESIPTFCRGWKGDPINQPNFSNFPVLSFTFLHVRTMIFTRKWPVTNSGASELKHSQLSYQERTSGNDSQSNSSIW